MSNDQGENIPGASMMRDHMRYWGTGVAVVTAAVGGEHHGMTINSFTSVSIDPPQVLISLEKNTRTHGLVETSNHFAITLLSEEQKEISGRFAGESSEEGDRFAEIDYFEISSGRRVLKDGLAFFDCKVVERMDAGTHSLFVAEVLEAGSAGKAEKGKKALIYFDRGYYKIGSAL